MIVALHPESVVGDPRTLRWVVPAGTLPFIGEVRVAPGALGDLHAEGVLDSVVTEALAVRTGLGPGHDWTTRGRQVRAAVADAVARPKEWQPVRTDARTDDARLAACAREVLDGAVGEYVRSHGGVVEFVSARNDVVEVALGGVCAHCPASGMTLQDRIEGAIRARHPRLRSVDRVATDAQPRRPNWSRM